MYGRCVTWQFWQAGQLISIAQSLLDWDRPFSPSAALSRPVSTFATTVPLATSTRTTVPSRLVDKAYLPSEVDKREVMASGWEGRSYSGSAKAVGSNIRRWPSEEPDMRWEGVYDSAHMASGWTAIGQLSLSNSCRRPETYEKWTLVANTTATETISVAVSM